MSLQIGGIVFIYKHIHKVSLIFWSTERGLTVETHGVRLRGAGPIKGVCVSAIYVQQKGVRLRGAGPTKKPFT